MKHIRRLIAPLALLLAVCLLFSGCLSTLLLYGLLQDNDPTPLPPETETEPAETVPPYTEIYLPEDLPGRLQNAGGRSYLADGEIDLVSFPEMEYVRPDVDAVCEAFRTATDRIADSSAETVLEAYYAAYDLYYTYYTMDVLAQIRYSIDTNDRFYKEEYDYCENSQPEVEEALEAFLKAAAESPLKADLEAGYFGEGYLDQYVGYSKYTDPDYLELAQQEEALLSEYRAALEDPQIDYGGKTQSYWDLLEQTEGTSEYYMVMMTYFNQYNKTVGDCYLKLVRVRRQLAAVMGYDSYAEYAYKETYDRDYAWEDGKAYIQAIREHLVPLYEDYSQTDAYYGLTAPAASEDTVRAALDEVTGALGGRIREAFEFMMAYDLCDLTQRDEKMDSSFEIYLHAWEVPFVMMNAKGTASDVTTFAHEFGHFTDAYLNYNADEDLETAETFSQSMEYLALSYLQNAVSPRTVTTLRQMQLADALEVFVTQAAFADFEDRVYALSDKDLTLERVNDIYRQICKDYGYYYEGADFYYSQSWIQITHFFEAPYYVLSYCLSADAALQIYQLESETPGAGVGKYGELLDRTPGAGFQTVLSDAGMEDPFAPGRIEEIAAFLEDNLPWD